MLLNEDAQFEIHVTGNRTKETYKGVFRAVRFLSHRQMLARDRYIRELLGPVAAEASEERQRAIALADCSVSLTKTPAFWSECGNGMDLVDDNVLVEVWKGIRKVQEDAVAQVSLSEKDKEDLKKEVAKDNV